MMDTAGNMRHIKLNCCFALSATQHPFSTKAFCEESPKKSIILNPKLWTVQLDLEKPEENAVDIDIRPHNNLLMTKCLHAEILSNLAANFFENLTVTHTSNHNLRMDCRRNFFAGIANLNTEMCRTFKNC